MAKNHDHRLFRNASPGPLIIAAALVLFLICLATTCRAEGDVFDVAAATADVLAPADENENGGFSDRRGVRIDVETGTTIFRGRTPQIGVTANFLNVGQAAGRDFDLQVGLGVIAEYRLYGVLYSNQLYFQALVIDGIGPVDVGVGGVYLQNTDQLNGSNANFSLYLAYRASVFGGRDNVKAYYRHFSNAGTALPNTGRDFIGLAYSF